MSNFPDFSSHGYQVIRELARNREAGRITYLAINLNLDQKVTIKEFRFASEGTSWSGFKAYQREIELLQQLDHPRIPRYFNSFETPLGFCLVQEYKNAPSLAERRSFTPEEIRTIAISVLEILVYLQKRTPPVIHRDIKPENILVDEQLNAYLVDFGLARIGGEQMALSSVAAGTPGFMPPEEQFGRPLSEASDLYSLGATLMCLVTGTRSVNIGTLINDEYRFNVEPLVPQLSSLFVVWLAKMVEPNVKKRFANAEQALFVLINSNKWETSKQQKGVALKVLLLLLYGLIWVSVPGLTVHLMQSFVEYSMNELTSNQINNTRRNYHQTYRAPQTNYRNRDVKWNATDWFNRGEYLFRRRYYSQALSAYNAAININPNYYNALVSRCATFNQILKYEKALVDCNKAIEISPNSRNTRVWVIRGHVFAGMGQYEESIASYDRAIAINPNNSHAWGGRCNTLNFLRKYEQALPNCEKALQIRPQLHSAWHNKGVALEGLGRNEEALNSYDQALRFQPHYSRSIVNHQRLRQKLGITSTDNFNLDKPANNNNFDSCLTRIPPPLPANSNKNYTRIPNTPRLLCPLNNTVFHHYPRETTLAWEDVLGAKSYTVEIDFYMPDLGWCSEQDKCKYAIVRNITTNRYTFNFVGGQPGRWRVWAVNSEGKESLKTNWWEFRYTK
ncbi:hypothetical protein NIES2119_28415 [[Phormidium ambiguum] IAM M-71]|uniref:non-specific serine/threonine protein kinase n=1 Tax=[Phormidium ambiguum] IAM M-71 TaxID=454136 RepID=A0A1U7I5K8_9CYAN|nr:serine/threonine-protein kinase [Phormidium ambiguum]OKH31534.1 hypothetical protein NIES2119_28415 [Phormidium ambiguum IAM M-71]